MRRILLTFALSLAFSLPASAQQLKLSFDEGRVSLDATGVPVRAILLEWARLGGTKVIGAERIAGSLTLKLESVPESQALEILLRSVAGYMAAPRRASAETGASMYDRILVMATSATPPPPRVTPAQGNAGSANQRFTPQRRPARQVEDEEEPEDEEDPNPPNAPVFTFPQPGQQNSFPQPGMVPNAQPSNGQANNPNAGAPQSITINPAASPGSAPTFGAPTPGMVVAPPAPPPQPGPMVRPPGGV